MGPHRLPRTSLHTGGQRRRPWGQTFAANDTAPRLQPSQRIDYELELGVVIGRPNRMGVPVPIEQAEDHIFGLTLLKDWSARDLQAWEYQPLGPFLSKNFASTLSPWMVTLEALAPFRRAHHRPEGDPKPLPYLDSQNNRQAGAFDIALEVRLQTQGMRAQGMPEQLLASSNYAQAAYWTMAQMVAHHTVNGCSLAAGDLLGTGTLSGPLPEQAGSLLELNQGGKLPVTLNNGEQRTFLQDGDRVSLRAFCVREGARRIGFGECSATLLSANP